ncbi:hypothetical protein FGG08_005345 [Glutinoglossum americanum]|uniref:NACHT domain-containing protein n=1 Tax=Glutinoglossum americanum TaxID=1670608 RepID=A0A9P8KYL3_9PEZI|nr:hypothetical protein FGG08_005345 [Glutinoglossum americanum]
MDPLSVASGVAGLLCLAIQVGVTIAEFTSSVKGASQEAYKLEREIQAFSAVLKQLSEFLQSEDADPIVFEPTSVLLVATNACDKELNALQKKLEKYGKGDRVSRAIQRLSWPFTEKENRETIDAIHRWTQLYNEERMEVLGWLSSVAHNEKQNDTLRRRHGNTGMWFLELAEFQLWLKGDAGNILWCKGDPGVGKTVLAYVSSLAIDHITKTRKDAGVVFFYFDFSAEDEQTLEQVISSLLKQLLLQLEELPAPVKQLFDRSVMKGQIPQVSELQELLLSTAKRFDAVYLVIDALDECKAGDCRSELLSALQQFEISMKLLVTSRPHPEDLNESLGHALQVKLEAVESDISDFVYKKLENRKTKKILGKDEKLKEDIVTSIVDGAHGMFLLPTLQIQAILDQTTKGEIRRCLKTLPKKLDDNFSDILKRIGVQPPSERDMAHRVLMWIAHAKRPLKIAELLHGLAVRSGEHDFDEDDLPCEDLLVEYCLGLVRIDPASLVVRLVHFTLQEYFDKNSQSLFPKRNSEITQACLTYLCFDAFGDGPCLSDEEYESRLDTSPFLQYAAQHWGDHARETLEDDYQGLAIEFCGKGPNLESAVQAMGAGNHLYQGYSQRFPKSYTCLHVATSFGIKGVVEALLDQGVDIEAKYEDGETALCIAAERGDVEVVRLLLDRGAQVEAEGNVGKRALHQSAWHGHEQVSKLLLDKGADIEATDPQKFTALHMAASYGQLGVIKQLLDKGANMEVKNLWTQTALHRAAVCNHPEAVKILLDNGADAEAKDYDGSTTLLMTASLGLLGVVKLLLDKGVSVEATDKWAQTALHKAALGGHLETVKALLDKGANIKANNIYGETALHRVALGGRLEVVKLLLERGADIDAADNNGRTALLMAASNGHLEVVKLLLSKGAKGNPEGIALLMAAPGDRLDLATRLLDTEAIKTTDECGQMALLMAASSDNLDVIKLLLSKGADIEAKDADGKTALYRSASFGHFDATKLLLDKGADIEVRERSYAHTALYDAAVGGHFDVVRLLLNRGADTEAKETVAGWTVLHWATAKGDLDLVELLLDNGANIEARNGNGGTALEMAEWVSHSKIAELIKLKMENAVYIGEDPKGENELSNG